MPIGIGGILPYFAFQSSNVGLVSVCTILFISNAKALRLDRPFNSNRVVESGIAAPSGGLDLGSFRAGTGLLYLGRPHHSGTLSAIARHKHSALG